MSAVLVALAFLAAPCGVALLVIGHRADRVAPGISLGITAATLAAAIVAFIARPSVSLGFISPTGATLAVDGLSAVLLLTVTAVTLLVLVFAVAEKTAPAARFHGLMLIFSAAVVVTVTATSLPALLAAWEIMGAASYALIGFHWQQPRTVPAGLVAFTVTRTADLGLYAAAGAAVAGGVGWSLSDLAGAPSPWLHVIAAGVLVAGLGKAAQLPFSFWLSRAMEGPSPVSALLHSAAMVAMGAYLLLRLEPVLLVSEWAAPTAAWLGAATTIVLGLIALAQTDLKQLLAASTAAQLGFVVLAAGVGSTAGGTAQLVGHAATKALLFLGAGAWLAATGTKQLAALRGVARRWPLLGVLVLVGAVTLAGLPPFALWWTKDAVLAGALETSPALYAAGLLGAALSAAYSVKIIATVWAKPDPRDGEKRRGDRRWDTEERGTRRVPAGALAPMIALAVAALVLGATAVPALAGPFRSLIGGTGDPQATVPELAVSAVIAVIVVLLVGLRGVPPLPGALAWFGLERAAELVVAGPALRLADGLSRFDQRLDAAVDGSARVLGALAGGLSRFDDRLDAAVDHTGRATDRIARAMLALDRGVDLGVERIASAVGRLGRTAGRLQTGRIADYYSAAAVVTIAALLLLIVVR
ncbi:MAG: NADH-quinone oxidoreductase subunit L [Burkholderiaceae bacterium]|nr:NADH-quinone oxidoreductase subunit L [Microbacteriaceae bacterium]